MPILSVLPPVTVVNVAVAVIHYHDQYLLGFRNQAQHQGNRYEFVGGKIDVGERAEAALIREVAEETGIDIEDNIAVKMGRLHHDYGDKTVCLQVYDVALTCQQYEQYQHCRYGLEGQALTWAAKDQLLAGDYALPAANQTILSWLHLPQTIAITYPLAHFDTQAAWLTYHQAHLPADAWVYIRPKTKMEEGRSDTELAKHLVATLMHTRPDIHSIIPWSDADAEMDDTQQDKSVIAYHLTQTQLLAWSAHMNNQGNEQVSAVLQSSKQQSLPPQPLIVSCHDVASIATANQLARTRLEQRLPPVIGLLLSPVLPTPTHPEQEGLGWIAWAELAQLADVPVIALGGLSVDMYEQGVQYGASSVAGIRHFHDG